MKDIDLGKFMGYDLKVVNVPDERYEYVKKAAIFHFNKMMEDYTNKPFMGVNLDLEVAKHISNLK
jgi:hypothetical protein